MIRGLPESLTDQAEEAEQQLLRDHDSDEHGQGEHRGRVVRSQDLADALAGQTEARAPTSVNATTTPQTVLGLTDKSKTEAK